ncbi:MAG TPA: DUF1007 family protein [Parvibaculum sp.]
MTANFGERARRVFVALFLLLAGTAPALAHPHVWIDMTVDLSFDNAKRLNALTVAWTFDEFYSAFAVQDFKKLPDGRYDPADLAKLADVNLANLKDWHYFAEVTAGGKPAKLGLARNGGSTYDAKAGRLTMTFTVPLVSPVAATAKAPIRFKIYDPSYYIAIDFVKTDPIHMISGAHDVCTVSTKVPNAEKIWTGLPESAFMGPKAVVLGSYFATTATLVCP